MAEPQTLVFIEALLADKLGNTCIHKLCIFLFVVTCISVHLGLFLPLLRLGLGTCYVDHQAGFNSPISACFCLPSAGTKGVRPPNPASWCLES